MALLRAGLGDRAEHVEFTDWADWYHSPQASLHRYRAFVKEKFEAGAVWIRMIADAGWSGLSAPEIAAWTRYESMINLAFGPAPATITCTYDLGAFPVDVIADAHCTHPEVAHGTRVSASFTYREPEDLLLEPIA